MRIKSVETLETAAAKARRLDTKRRRSGIKGMRQTKPEMD